MSSVTIKGVNINLDADDLKKVKNTKQLRKLNIFEHLSDSDKDTAETELATKLGIVADTTTPEESLTVK